MLLAGVFLIASTMLADPLVLWPDGAPGALGARPADVPTLTPFWPDPKVATGAAIVICPGGGYGGLADHEGADYARWLSGHGIAAFVLKYRLGTDGYRHPAPAQDLARALRLVRTRAVAWKIDPHQIGVMGSSAGGHLAATALTHFDAGDPAATDPVERQSSRPDFGVLCYPVISMTAPVTHAGSRTNLLGPHPDPKLADELSAERRVTAETAPCFLWTTADDPVVPMGNSLLFAEALAIHKVPVELHVYESGPHGIGLDRDPKRPDIMLPWTVDLRRWLYARGFIAR